MKSPDLSKTRALAGGAAGLLAIILLFHVYGITVWTGSAGRSLFRWLYMMWSTESTEAVDYSHGLVIPFISLWLLWRQRVALIDAFKQDAPRYTGPFLTALALGMHFAGMRSQLPHLSAMALIVSLWAWVWTFGGKQAARLTLFPIAFLAFAIPVGFLARATFPLRIIGSVTATELLNGLGIATTRIGTAVYSSAGQGFAMDVADACSGIRSMMALMALTAAYAYLFRNHWFARWFLFIMSVPIAALANIGRIVTIAIVATFMGQDVGMKLYHDYSGYLVFVLAVLLVVGFNALLDPAQRLLATCQRRREVT